MVFFFFSYYGLVVVVVVVVVSVVMANGGGGCGWLLKFAVDVFIIILMSYLYFFFKGQCIKSINSSGVKNLAIWHIQKSLYLFYLFTLNINRSIFLTI